MEGLTQPTLLLKPFAQSGTKNTLPDVNTDTSNPQKADLTNGFPTITSLEPDDGGLPPERADLNGLGYLTTAYDYFYQAGGTFTFNQTISTAIGGYPLGARLWYFNGTESYIVRSTKNNNDDNFITTPSFIGTSWVVDTVSVSVLSLIYPVGSIYIGTQSTCPMAALIAGSSWELVGANRALWTGDGTNGNTVITAGLPNITGTVCATSSDNTSSGAFYRDGYGQDDADTWYRSPLVKFDASRSNAIYGASDTVQPPAYVVNVWRRTA